MIKIEGRSLKIPTQERIIGWVGDNRVEVRIFELIRHYGDIDLSEFDFKLDTEINGTKNIIDLDKSVTEDKITLTWTIAESHILHPGHMSIQIRAFKGTEEKWHSAQAYVRVQPSINAEQSIPDPLPSEFVQMEQRVTAAKNEAQAAAQTATEQAGIATTKAQEASDSAAAALASEQAAKTSEDNAAGHARTATEQADRAQDIADTFENETLPAAITAVEAAGQAKVDLAEQQANIAAGHAQTAAAKAEETSGYVNDAFEYKEAAEGAASIATEKAWEAANSAQIAEQQAGIAATKATEAYDSAERAKMSEEAVEGVADEHRLKIAKLEKELNEYKATMQQVNINQEPKQKATGYGVISLPPNAAEGQISVVLKGFTNTNLVPYPKMDTDSNSDGIVDGFATSIWGCSPSYSLDGGQKITMGGATASNVYAGIQTLEYIPVSAGKTYTLSVEAKLVRSAAETVELVLIWHDANNTIISSNGLYNQNPGTNYQRLSFTVTAPANAAKVKVFLRLRASSTSDTGSAWFKNIQLEPNPQASSFIVGTKSTVCAFRGQAVGKNLLNPAKVYNPMTDTTGIWDGTTLTVTGKWYCAIPLRVKRNTQYTCQAVPGTGSYKRIAVYSSIDGVSVGNSLGGIGVPPYAFTFNSGENDWVLALFYAGVGSDGMQTYTNIQIEEGTQATPYEPYRESNVYVIAKDKEGKIIELKSVPSAKDEINVTDRKLIKRIGEKSNIANGMVIDFADMAEGGTYYAWNDDGETEAGIKGDTLGIDATTLIYQLAEPIEMPVQVSGTLIGHPSGTVYLEPFVPDAGIYDGGISILHHDLPIKSIERISKIDYTTGLEYDLDVSKATIAQDKLSFTHPDIEDGDIIFFVYEYDRESTTGEMAVEYYDSRFVVEDSAVPGKFYKIKFVVTNGVASIVLEEV